jgi:hypothetical protein
MTTDEMEELTAKAVESAKRYFRGAYEHFEVWEWGTGWLTIRAWDNTEDADYAFFTARNGGAK